MVQPKAFPLSGGSRGMDFRQYLAGEVVKGLLAGNMFEQMGVASADLVAKDVRNITDAIIKELEESRV